MSYYPPIYYFHLFIGVILLAVIISGLPDLGRLWRGDFQTPDTPILLIDIAVLVGYLTAVIPYQPSKVKHAMEVKRRIWESVLKPTTSQVKEPEAIEAPVKAKADA